MIIFKCHVCQQSLRAEESQVGILVRCPSCSTTLRVPAPEGAVVSVGAPAEEGGQPDLPVSTPPPPRTYSSTLGMPRMGGKRYGFNCGYCSSRLEATEAMAAQEGQCPTCGNQITIPILDRYGRLIDPKTRQIIKQDPHPVHAYAAAGDRAPAILRQADGKQMIKCQRCNGASPISANNCKACGMPFTMEGTTVEAAGASNGFSVAALVLGIIGIPAGCTIVIPVLAIIFGIVGYNQTGKGEGQGGGGMAIAGIVCGAVGLAIGGFTWAGRI